MFRYLNNNIATVLVGNALFLIIIVHSSGCFDTSNQGDSNILTQDSDSSGDSLVGAWRSEGFRPWLHEWKNATKCELIVRRVSKQKDKEQSEFRYPTKGKYDISLFLVNESARWRAPDSVPGWIDKNGVLWMGPIGSALRFDITFMDKKRILLQNKHGKITFHKVVSKGRKTGHP